MTILLESDLHTKILQTRMTANLESLVTVIKTELDFALSTEVPQCEGKQSSERCRVSNMVGQSLEN